MHKINIFAIAGLLTAFAYAAPAIACSTVYQTVNRYSFLQSMSQGFESGQISGSGCDYQVGDTSASGVDSSYPLSGKYEAYFGPINNYGGITDSFTVYPGAGYKISFWLAQQGGSSLDGYYLSVNGTTVAKAKGVGSMPYTFYTYTVKPQVDSGYYGQYYGTLSYSLEFYNPTGYFYLDNLHISAIPLPPSLLLMASGICVVTFAAAASRKKRTI